MNHYGYRKTITTFEDLARQHDEMSRHLEQLQGDGSWQTVCSYSSPAKVLLLISDGQCSLRYELGLRQRLTQ
jgi:hypothetical protein